MKLFPTYLCDEVLLQWQNIWRTYILRYDLGQILNLGRTSYVATSVECVMCNVVQIVAFYTMCNKVLCDFQPKIAQRMHY